MYYPMGLYKLVTYGRQSDGWDLDSDYTEWDIYRVAFYKGVDAGRKIVNPDGLFKHIMADYDVNIDEFGYDICGDTMYIKTLYWRWYDSNGRQGRPWEMAIEEGIRGWDWDYV